jgi:hypothetical protein
MGLLDPKRDPDRTFELLEKKGAIRAELPFEGGHDEGSVETILLTLKSGEVVEMDTWYCGGYGLKDGQWVPLSTPQTLDEELADLLEGPINAEFGGWGSVPSTRGTLVWDVFTRKAKLSYSQEEYVEHDYEVEL